MKVKITQKGVTGRDASGSVIELPVGTELDVGDTIPSNLVNKCQRVLTVATPKRTTKAAK